MEDKDLNQDPNAWAGSEPKKDEPWTNADKGDKSEPKKDEPKADDVDANKTEALKQERERRKAIEAELAEYKKKEAEAIEKEKLKKWKYEEVLKEKDEKLAELQTQITELSWYKEKLQTSMTNQIKELEKKIPEWKKEFVSKVIVWKSHDEQVEILSEFAKEFSGSSSTSNWNHKADWWAFETAKQKWSILWMIASAPVIK